MAMKKITAALLQVTMVFLLAACSAGEASSPETAGQGDNSSTPAVEAVDATSSADTAVWALESVSAAAAENSEIHEDSDDYTWDNPEVVTISLEGNSISADEAGVTIDDNTVTITSAGTYNFTGSLKDGQIIVNTEDEDVVRLLLSGVDVASSTKAPIDVEKAEKVVIVLVEGTSNNISDSSEYVFPNADTDEPNAAIFSNADLTIWGSGNLTVEGNYNDGIASKDGLIIAGGNIEVEAVDDGIRGKDYLVIKNSQVVVDAGGDGLKSDNEKDADRGFIFIESGIVAVNSGGDAIDATTDVLIRGGEINLTAGGGSSARADGSLSAKGIKGDVSVSIDGGTFTLNAADDAVHSNGSITVNAGDFDISTGDDGMHADESLTINGGIIRIANSYEGLESAMITINAGELDITSSDDGINVAGGVDSSGMMPGMLPEGRQRPGGGGQGQDAFAASGDYYLYIHGGTIVVDASGDGLDVNGAVEMNGGYVLIHGPTENMNGALDYLGGFKITGGFLAAVGSAGMAQAPDQSSSQYSFLVNFTSPQSAGTIIHIQNSAGENLLTFEPNKTYQSLTFSSAQLANGETYTIYLGGSASGTATGGLYLDSAYDPGDEYAELTTSSVVTVLGGGGMMGEGRIRP